MRVMVEPMKGPLYRYRALTASGALDHDPAQEAAATRLQALTTTLEATPPKGSLLDRIRGIRSTPPPKGLYLWGGVGRGKSLLMDIFFNNTDIARKRRVHFHEFMAETHERINYWRQASRKERRRHPDFNKKTPDDPIPLAAGDIAQEAQLLCFDEFQVTDITDATILGRLFAGLFERRVTIVSTSNRHPDDLYKDGLNRQLFLPAIAMIKDRMDIFELVSAKDYRLARLKGAPVYHTPLGPDATRAMDAAWAAAICGAEAAPCSIRVKGRDVPVPLAARGAARFSFSDLCAKPLGPSDYLAIVKRYDTLFIDDIPKLSPEKRNEAKRFVALIDAIYERRTKLLCSADAAPGDLYPAGDGAFEFERTASRLMEMQSHDYLSAAHIVADIDQDAAHA